MSLSEKQKMLAGQLYHAGCPELQAEQIANKHWMHRYNSSVELLNDARHGLLAEHFNEVGEGAVIRPPFYCDYGYNISVGRNTFMNFNCVILDVVQVRIGDDCQIGPNVQIYTADHPLDPEVRRSGLEEWAAGDHWQQRVDWRCGDHPAGGDHWRQRRGGRRQCGDAGCAGGCDGSG